MLRSKWIKVVSVLTVSALIGTGCAANAKEDITEVTPDVAVEESAEATSENKSESTEQMGSSEEALSDFEKWASEEVEWPSWAEPIEMEISNDIKYGPSVRKTFSLEEAQEIIGKLRYLVENTEGTVEHPYHNIWKGNLGTGLLQLGEYQLAYQFLNDVYTLPEDAPFGTDKVDGNVVILTKGEEQPHKRIHGRILKALSMAGFKDEVLEMYAKEDYTNIENVHSWGVTSAAWAMDNIGENELAYELFDSVAQPEAFGEARPYQASSNILAAAAFAYQHGDYEKAVGYTDRIVSEGVEPMNLAYFKGQDLESERRMVYYNRHWKSSFAIAQGWHALAQRALNGEVASFDNLKDGVYTKENTGYMLTPIIVEVTVEGGKVTQITADQPGDKDDRSAAALATIPGRIVEAGSLEVDSISSATISTESIKLSVAEALLQAK